MKENRRDDEVESSYGTKCRYLRAVRIKEDTFLEEDFERVRPNDREQCQRYEAPTTLLQRLYSEWRWFVPKIGGGKIGSDLPGKHDIVFPFLWVAVSLDGCFWHGCPRCGHVPEMNTKFWQTKFG